MGGAEAPPRLGPQQKVAQWAALFTCGIAKRAALPPLLAADRFGSAPVAGCHREFAELAFAGLGPGSIPHMTTSRHAKAKLKDRPIPIRHIKPGTRAFDRSTEQVLAALGRLLARLDDPVPPQQPATGS